AKAAQILGDDTYAQVARRSADFLRSELWRETDQVLLRRFRDGEAAVEGFLDDYAMMALALLDLYETTFDSSDLEWAITLAHRAIELFADTQHGGFFSTVSGKQDL